MASDRYLENTFFFNFEQISLQRCVLTLFWGIVSRKMLFSCCFICLRSFRGIIKMAAKAAILEHMALYILNQTWPHLACVKPLFLWINDQSILSHCFFIYVWGNLVSYSRWCTLMLSITRFFSRMPQHFYLNHRKYLIIILLSTFVCKYRSRAKTLAIKHLIL